MASPADTATHLIGGIHDQRRHIAETAMRAVTSFLLNGHRLPPTRWLSAESVSLAPLSPRWLSVAESSCSGSGGLGVGGVACPAVRCLGASHGGGGSVRVGPPVPRWGRLPDGPDAQLDGLLAVGHSRPALPVTGSVPAKDTELALARASSADRSCSLGSSRGRGLGFRPGNTDRWSKGHGEVRERPNRTHC